MLQHTGHSPFYQLMLTRETDLMQDIQIYKNLQDWLTVAAYRVRYESIWCLHAGGPKGPVKGLELTVVSFESLHQEAKGSTKRSWRGCAGSWSQCLRRRWRLESFSKEMEVNFSLSFPFYSIQVASLLVGGFLCVRWSRTRMNIHVVFSRWQVLF